MYRNAQFKRAPFLNDIHVQTNAMPNTKLAPGKVVRCRNPLNTIKKRLIYSNFVRILSDV